MKPCPLTNDAQKRIAATELTAGMAQEFPRGVAQPALRALASAGYRRLEDLVGVSERDLAQLHGIGPKALQAIREALQQKWKSLAK